MGGKSSSVTVGYRYRMGLHFGISHGPVDALGQIRVGDRIAWSGQQTVSGPITIDAPKLFGGDKREGGVDGTADVMMGEPSQLTNDYLVEQIPGLMPAFRGLFGVVFRGGLVASNNPYVKPWAFKVTRVLAGWGGQQVTAVTEYSNSVLYPWIEETNDPRNCKNEHEYQREGTGSPAWRSTLAEAIADAEAHLGYSIPDTVLGWSKGTSSLARQTVSPYVEVDPGEEQVLYLHFNRYSAGVTTFYGGLNVTGSDACGGFFNAGFVPGSTPDFYWTGLNLSGGSALGGSGIYRLSDRVSGTITPPALVGSDTLNNCIVYGHGGDAQYPFFTAKYDTLIRVRRKVRAPDDPCNPQCEGAYPDYPDDTSYCLIGSVPTKKGAWSLDVASYKALAVYQTSSGIVTQYPLNPTLPSTDPNYSNEEYWTDQYNAAVSAGTMPAGMTYNAAGTGPDSTTYPQLLTEAYTRSGGSITEGDPWNPDYAQIDAHMNPAHIIYQCLTDEDWGIGYPTALIDEDAFDAAAQTLAAEEFGLSLLWNQQSTVGDFIGIVLDHIGAVLYADPRTGKFVLKLIRDDYSVSDLDVLDEQNISQLVSFQRAGYGETVNEITVVYIDANTDKEASITVQDLANIQAQGQAVSQTRQYPGIKIPSLAARVAERDLIAASVPLAKIKVKVNRMAWDKVPGEVVKLSWAKLGIEQLVCRVLAVNYGSLNDGEITIDLAEDVFGLPESVYVEQQEGEWVEPDTLPQNVDPADVLELPYWDVARNLSAADLDYTDADAAYIGTLGAKGNPTETEYNIYARLNVEDYALVNTGPFAPTAVLSADVSRSDTVLPYTSGEQIADVELGGRVLIGTGRSAEWGIVVGVDTISETLTVSRGILDTTPQVHVAGTRIWFVEDAMGADLTERATGEALDYKLVAIAPGGETELEDATELSIVPDQRFYRPYAPGNVLINGEAFPESVDVTDVSDSLTITWSHRDRIQQTAYLVEQDEGNIGPEADVVYNAYIYDDSSDVLQDSVMGTSLTTWSPSLSGSFVARLEIESERGSEAITSWQRQVRTFVFIGAASITTEDDIAITTETGAPITEEH